MCGFFGDTMGRSIGRGALAHRGPDAYGVYRDEGVVLEHWRLSIIDLSANGSQPMSLGDDEMHVIAYNGEVYNFHALRRELGDADFRSATDTEVVLRLYRRDGLKCLPKLNGMFAFAIYDRAQRRIVLARDRFGIKPLYYRIGRNGSLSFASELRALLAADDTDLTLDPAAIQSLFHLLYIEGERTPFEQIKKLPPGCCLVYDLERRTFEISRYHSFSFHKHNLSPARCIDRIEELLSESVRMHLIADVPVGALLSGGVDSSLLVALMSRYAPEVHTFSVGHGDGTAYDESRYFNLVAAKYHTRHSHTVLEQQSLAPLVERVCRELDEPLGDTSVFLNYFIFGFVSESVKVCLSGLGGDELFGGYNRYLACRMLPVYAGLPATFRRALQIIVERLPASRATRIGNKVRHIKTFLKHTDPELGSAYCHFIDYFSQTEHEPVTACTPYTHPRFESCWDEHLLDEIDRIYKYDIENYMVNDLLMLTDRMSMRHSVEARVPYLENELVDFALGLGPQTKIRGFTLKHALKKVAERHLPREIIYRRKQGFSSPTAGLLTEKLLKDLLTEIDASNSTYIEILNRPVFTKIIQAHRQGVEDYSLQIFTLLIYVKWMRSVFEQLQQTRDAPVFTSSTVPVARL